MSARAAIALYVALALHLLAVLLIVLSPAPQWSSGEGHGLGVGLRLAGSDDVLRARPPTAKPEPTGPPPSSKLARTIPAAPRKSTASPTPVRVTDVVDVAARRSGSAAPEAEPAISDPAETSRSGALEAVSAAAGGGGANSYFGRLRQHLHRFRRDLPVNAKPGRAELALVIEADGRVSSLRLERRSLSALLDEEALALVRRAEPLPRPPGGEALRVVVPVLIDRD